MNPVKILGGILIIVGVILRAISVYVLHRREQTLPDSDRARRSFARSRRNSLLVDAAFIACGVLCIVRP